jgi:stage II sporulation protein D
MVCGALMAETPSGSLLSERIAAPIAPKNIQVLLEKDASEVLLEVQGPYSIYNPHDGAKISAGLIGKRFIIRELEGGLKWGEEFPGVHQIYIKPRSADTSIFINGIQYQGAVAVYGVASQINIVNDIDIESYILSLLNAQFSTPLESEVMASLAILARTDAYYHATTNPHSFWHVDAKEVGYQGSALNLPKSPAQKAVDTTRHLILVHPSQGKPSPFPTAWTEHSAGKTIAYEAMFRKEVIAPEQGVEAPHAALARNESKWTYQISKNKLSHLLDLSSIHSVESFVDPESHKVYGIRFKDAHDIFDIDFLTLQEKLGKNHLKSSDFQVAVKDDAILFTGYGMGHGAGLCLYSASAMAQNGENALKILSKFFPETYLCNLDAIPPSGNGVVK